MDEMHIYTQNSQICGSAPGTIPIGWKASGDGHSGQAGFISAHIAHLLSWEIQHRPAYGGQGD